MLSILSPNMCLMCIELSVGNRVFRDMIRLELNNYSAALDKTNKSRIISRVMNKVKDKSLFGGFVKQDLDTERWFVLDKASVRVTIAQVQ